MYCRLLSKHTTLTFPSRARTLNIIPISSRELLIIFKDFSYISYDIITSTIGIQGKLPQLQRPERYFSADQNNIVLVYSKFIYIFNHKVNTFTRYEIMIDKQFRSLLYFQQSFSLTVIVEKINFHPVQLVQYFLLQPEKTQRLQLNSSFKQPYLFKTSSSTFVIADFSYPSIFVKQMSILSQQFDIVQLISNNTPLDVSVVIGCFFSDNKLNIFAMKKDKMLFMQYFYSSNDLSESIQLKEQIIINSVIGEMQEHYAIIYTELKSLQSCCALISKQGIILDEIRAKKFQLQNAKLSLDGTSFFEFSHCNEKRMQKQKLEIPTLVKFHQIKSVNKGRLYFHILKESGHNIYQGLSRIVLNILK